VQKLAPMTAGLAVQAGSEPGRRVPIGPWAGLGVLAGYAAAGTALGYLSIRVRDA
jgi:ABC-2 type transport system permease protein